MKKSISIVFIVLLSIFTFKNLFSTYFQQDEWHAFGIMLADGWGYVSLHQSPFQLLFGGDRAGARSLNYLLFSVFGLNPIPTSSFAFRRISSVSVTYSTENFFHSSIANFFSKNGF